MMIQFQNATIDTFLMNRYTCIEMAIATNLYRSSVVCEVIGVKPVTLRQWSLRGIFVPETEEISEAVELAPAIGKQPPQALVRVANEIVDAQRQGWRLYTLNDIVRLRIIRHLTSLGFNVERAAMVANEVGVECAMRGKSDTFVVAFLPVEGSDDSPAMQRRVGYATKTATGREALAHAFSTAGRLPAEAGLLSRDMGVVVNVSAYVREVQQKLAEIDGGDAG